MYINNVIVGGNMTADAEVFRSGDGSQCAGFSIALNEPRANGGKQAYYIDVKAWGKAGEFVVRYLRRGSPVVVEGSIRVEEWTRKDGSRGRKWYVLASRVQGTAQRPQENAGDTAGRPAIDDSDVPDF